MPSGWRRRAALGLIAALAATTAPRSARSADEAPAAGAAAPAPSAADLARARALFAQGEAAAAAGRWADAVARFEAVRAIKETPGVVFHLAAAREGGGELAAALTLFERARDLARASGVADVLELADARIAALGHRVPRVIVKVSTPAEVSGVALDGAPLAEARWGEPLRVDPGPHRVEATFRGAPFARDLTLVEGAWITVVVGDPSAPTVAAAPTAAPTTNTTTLPATGLGPPESTADGPPLGPLVLGAGGLALAVGGVVAFAVAGSESSSATEACAGAEPTACDPGARDTVRALDGLALGLWIGGAAALGGATVWWVLADDHTVEARITPQGARVSGRF